MCQLPPVPTAVYPVPVGVPVTCESYTGCDASSEVISCSIEHGGHTIPGGYVFPIEKFIGVGRSTTDIDGAEFIWEFFSSHSMR